MKITRWFQMGDDEHGTAVVEGGGVSPDESNLPDTTDSYDRLPSVEVVASTADGMEEVNRVVWQIAKFIWYVAAIFFAIATMVMMYHAAKFVVAL